MGGKRGEQNASFCLGKVVSPNLQPGKTKKRNSASNKHAGGKGESLEENGTIKGGGHQGSGDWGGFGEKYPLLGKGGALVGRWGEDHH